MSVGNRILKCDERLDRSILEKFADIPVAVIGDACNKNKCVHRSIKRYNNVPLLGQAYTVKVPAGDNLFILYAIEHCQPGDIIVIDGEGYESRALVGELLSLEALRRKVGGFVIDGAIRDINEIESLPIPVYARNISPNGPYRFGPGEINVPVVMEGQVINPGDILVGDREGIVVIRPNEVEEVYKKALAILENEEEVKKTIASDKSPWPFLDKMMEQLNTEIEE